MEGVLVTLGGETLRLSLNFEKICRIENLMECSIFSFAEQLAEGKIAVRNLADVIAICAEKAPQAMGQALIECGLFYAAEMLAELLCQLFSVGVDHTGDIDDLKAMMRRFPDMVTAAGSSF